MSICYFTKRLKYYSLLIGALWLSIGVALGQPLSIDFHHYHLTSIQEDTIVIDSSAYVVDLQNITVTESVKERRKNSESLNLEIVDSEYLHRYRSGSLMTTLARLPGVKAISIGSGQSKPLLRGMGFNRVVVVDRGIKHEGQQWGADHGLEIDQFELGEVELLKGAASFIYGSDAIGGVVHVKPFTIPEIHTSGGSVDLLGKSNNGLLGASLQLYQRKRHWYYRARASQQSYGDYKVPTDQVYVYDYVVDLDKGYVRNTAGREKAIHVDFGYSNDRFSNTIYLSHVYSKSGFFANAHGLEPRRVDRELHDASHRDIQQPSQRVSHFKWMNRSVYETASHQYEFDVAYQKNFRQEFSPYVSHGFMPSVFPDGMTMPDDLEREFDKDIYSLNLRDRLRLGRHIITWGLNGEHQVNDIDGWTFLTPAFRQTGVGAYLYDKMQLNDRMLLHSALRYDYSHIHIYRYEDWFDSGDDVNGLQKVLRADELKRNFRSWVLSVGVNYNLSDLALKANLGKSFRVPIAKELGANGVNYHYFSYERGDPTLSAEQSYQLDISARWSKEQWSIELSPFYNYFPNYIYLNPTAEYDYLYGAGNQIYQYAESRVRRYGGEVAIRWAFAERWSSSLVGEYLYSEQLSGAKKGYTLPFSPPTTGLINLTWSPQIGDNVKGVYLSIDYRVAASQNNIVPPEKKTAGYQIWDLQLGAETVLYGQRVIMALQAQNLLNTRYMNHTSFYRLIELPEAGRNIVLSVKLPFVFNH